MAGGYKCGNASNKNGNGKNGTDQSGNTTPDADILLKKAKRDEDKLRIVRFIDKYGL